MRKSRGLNRSQRGNLVFPSKINNKMNQQEDDHFDNWPEPTTIVGIIGAIVGLTAVATTIIVAYKIF